MNVTAEDIVIAYYDALSSVDLVEYKEFCARYIELVGSAADEVWTEAKSLILENQEESG